LEGEHDYYFLIPYATMTYDYAHMISMLLSIIIMLPSTCTNDIACFYKGKIILLDHFLMIMIYF